MIDRLVLGQSRTYPASNSLQHIANISTNKVNSQFIINIFPLTFSFINRRRQQRWSSNTKWCCSVFTKTSAMCYSHRFRRTPRDSTCHCICRTTKWYVYFALVSEKEQQAEKAAVESLSLLIARLPFWYYLCTGKRCRNGCFFMNNECSC